MRGHPIVWLHLVLLCLTLGTTDVDCSCTGTNVGKYPRPFGGSVGDTVFNAVTAKSSNFDVAMGGYTLDYGSGSALFSSASNQVPIVLCYSASMALKWSVSIGAPNPLNNEVSALKFLESKGNLIAVLGN